MSDFNQGPLVDADSIDLPPVDGVRLPEVQARTYPLTDDDAGQCRPVGEDELTAGYVDNNIAAIQPIQTDPWTLDPAFIDAQELRVTYTDGRQFATRLGTISTVGGPAPSDFRKTGGIIFPVDASGQALLDATNTPRLAYIRSDFHAQLAQLAEQRLEMATIVFAFSGCVAAAQALNGARFDQPPAPSFTWTDSDSATEHLR